MDYRCPKRHAILNLTTILIHLASTGKGPVAAIFCNIIAHFNKSRIYFLFIFLWYILGVSVHNMWPFFSTRLSPILSHTFSKFWKKWPTSVKNSTSCGHKISIILFFTYYFFFKDFMHKNLWYYKFNPLFIFPDIVLPWNV